MADDERTLKIVFIGDSEQLQAELDKIEQRAAKGVSVRTTPGGATPAEQERLSDRYEVKYENRLAGDRTRQTRDVERAQIQIAREMDRELVAVRRQAEAEERRAAAAERAAQRYQSQVDRRVERNFESAQFAQFRASEREESSLTEARTQAASDLALGEFRQRMMRTGQVQTAGPAGPGYLGRYLIRRVAIGAAIYGTARLIGQSGTNQEQALEEQYQDTTERLQTELSRNQTTGFGRVPWEGFDTVFGHVPGLNAIGPFARAFSPTLVEDTLRQRIQGERVQLAFQAQQARLEQGNYQTVAAENFGNRHAQAMAEVEQRRSAGNFAAQQVHDQLLSIGANPNQVNEVYQQSLSQVSRQAAAGRAAAGLERAQTGRGYVLAGLVAGLQAAQRPYEAEQATLRGQNIITEKNQRDPELRRQLEVANRAEERAQTIEIQRQRGITAYGYSARTAGAAAAGRNDPITARLAELGEAANAAVENAPAEDKLRAAAEWTAKFAAFRDEVGRNVEEAGARGGARLAASRAATGGFTLEASLARLQGERQVELLRLPNNQLFAGVRRQSEQFYDSEAERLRHEDQLQRGLVIQGLQANVDVTGLEARGQQFSARGREIAERSRLTAARFAAEGGPDALARRRLALQAGVNEEEAFLRQLRLQSEGSPISNRGIAGGGIPSGFAQGAGPNLLPQTTGAGIEAVVNEIRGLRHDLLGAN